MPEYYIVKTKEGAPYIQEISQEILFIFSKIVLEQINLATVKI